MGFFDKFKRNNKQNSKDGVSHNDSAMPKLPLNIEWSQLNNGNLQVEFYDTKPDFKKFYDITRLIIKQKPLNIEGHQIYNCAVSWYGSDDCQIFNKESGKLESSRANDYRGVLAEINLELLQNDPYYCNMVMNKLLDKQRVEKYLETGLEETPETPCGKYIGGVMKVDFGYKKFFSVEVGKASHNSNLMVGRRLEHRKMLEEQRKRIIANKKSQIQQLQSEIDNLEK